MAHTTIGKRKRIRWLHFQKGHTIRDCASMVGVSYFQAYNAVKGRVKTGYSSRADKGTKRGPINKGHKAEMAEAIRTKSISQSASVSEFFNLQYMKTLEEINNRKMGVAERAKLLKDLTYAYRNMKQLELEEYIKRPDAILIARIMRRFDQLLTDDDVIRIYREEFEKLQAEK